MRAPYVLSLSPHSSIVIPAKAGIQNLGIGFPSWIAVGELTFPAFAGMTMS
ncbi:MAG: hypothetical protein LKF30_12055 [Sphingobium sp.]|jgi:hypothetical protein|nr:hypothetical protein [Sphingobium sp.]MCI1271522.1 hypothetical protein [Sphingobium sp.]MCI1756836.1 hypothetical protein [Sphingobium sp.]MCI2052417.1 hypothetical protein [Sphingobium sp.]